MKKHCYETKPEECESYGTHYTSYAVFTRENDQATILFHDVTMDQEEANKLCSLLNAHDLEPEQARYVVEDYITEKYLVEA